MLPCLPHYGHQSYDNIKESVFRDALMVIFTTSSVRLGSNFNYLRYVRNYQERERLPRSFQNLQASSVLDDFIFQAREWDALLVERQSNFISAGESLIMSKKHPVSAQGCLLTKAKHTASSRPSSNSPPAPQSSSSATKHPQAPPNAHQLPSNPRHRPTPFSHHHQSFKSRSPSKLQVAVSEPVLCRKKKEDRGRPICDFNKQSL
ncbi:hypothetical protein NC652_020805 [Populus alba x Populus x berolinensis]|nr:hypothetical protein NC652_020805 [Populus alba x Populus x berolinensis]